MAANNIRKTTDRIIKEIDEKGTKITQNDLDRYQSELGNKKTLGIKILDANVNEKKENSNKNKINEPP